MQSDRIRIDVDAVDHEHLKRTLDYMRDRFGEHFPTDVERAILRCPEAEYETWIVTHYWSSERISEYLDYSIDLTIRRIRKWEVAQGREIILVHTGWLGGTDSVGRPRLPIDLVVYVVYEARRADWITEGF